MNCMDDLQRVREASPLSIQWTLILSMLRLLKVSFLMIESGPREHFAREHTRYL